MEFDVEHLMQILPRQRKVIFDDQLEASAHAVFQIIGEFFGPLLQIHTVKFGAKYWWLGFRAVRTGEEEWGLIRIESRLGVEASGQENWFPLDIPPYDVGSVSVWPVSSYQSRVTIEVNHTPEVLTDLFKMLAYCLVAVIHGQDCAEAWSGGGSPHKAKLIEATARSSRKTSTQNPGKSSRAAKQPSKTKQGQSRERKLFLPSNPLFLQRYREAWGIIQELQQEYVTQFNDDLTREKPNPSIAELCDAIGKALEWKPSPRTVSRVKRAGREHLLDE
jgi:hypothetical protein